MPNLNRVMLIGHCGQDPTIRHSQSGEMIANVSLATTEKYKDKTGEWQTQTEWHRLVFFGRVAEVVQQYVAKGRAIYVEGKLKTNKWTDKEGVERCTTDIVCSSIQLLDRLQPVGSTNVNTATNTATNTTADAGQKQNEYAKAKARTSSNYQPRPVSSNDLADDFPF